MKNWIRLKAALFPMVLFASTAAMAAQPPAPVWDLAKDDIPGTLKSGPSEKVDGRIALKEGAAFAVPASAFVDPKNFTVQVTVSLDALVDRTLFTAMTKQGGPDGENNGFSFGLSYRREPWYARYVFTNVNNVLMKTDGITARGLSGKEGPKADAPYTFTLSVRDGFASFYIDELPYAKCYMEVVPNGEPMWIGRNSDPQAKPMDVVIHDVKVYGPDYHYVSAKEAQEAHPRGRVAGKGWALDVPKIEHPDWPKVLIYGDSISMGYRNDFIPALLARHVYVFHCVHFINGEVSKQALEELASRYQFDVIVFNNGLHSLHWTPDKVSDQQVHDRMTDLAECFEKGAPQAKIFYLLTTPHTAKRPAPDQPVDAMGDKNDTVIRLNKISEQVMREQGIPVIDDYSALAAKLNLAAGDQFHWQAPAYKIISEEIQRAILPVLGKNAQ